MLNHLLQKAKLLYLLKKCAKMLNLFKIDEANFLMDDEVVFLPYDLHCDEIFNYGMRSLSYIFG